MNTTDEKPLEQISTNIEKKKSGICRIKAEYILEDRCRQIPDKREEVKKVEDTSSTLNSTSDLNTEKNDKDDTESKPSESKSKLANDDSESINPESEPLAKKQKLDENSKIPEKSENSDNSEKLSAKSKKSQKFEKKEKNRGQNKARPVPFKLLNQNRFCPWLLDQTAEEKDRVCTTKLCIFMHDRVKYLDSKPKDISDTCHLFEMIGKCPRGISCRVGSSHISSEGYNIVDKEKLEAFEKNPKVTTKNQISKIMQEKLRKFKYDFRKAETIVFKHTPEKYKDTVKPKSSGKVMINVAELNERSRNKSYEDEQKTMVEKEKEKMKEKVLENDKEEKPNGAILDTEEIKLRKSEKKTIVWKDKLMLSPLTTVGNLPFRRICKEYGADITCGEMALAIRILKGAQEEWALTKRHESEDIFGVQICGNKPGILTRCAQLLNQEIEVDFIDINLGCPIDLVYKQGAGCGMLNRSHVLETTIKSVSEVLDIPLTVKTRTGIYMDRPIAHNLMPKFREWGASMIHLHGRSREQRYTKMADWPYIEKCAEAAAPVPLFGAGDILSYEDYQRVRTNYPSVSGVSIGRGALIKPWIFQEIKEQKLIDLSSSERFDMLKKYVKYGLEHWGSDTRGVETTRRFLLEWISFLHRYVPVGILEYPPQKMNERPPYYKGRDHLETLMASSNCKDWIQISEMLLGKVPDGFHFLPKHKANSWK